MGSRWEEELRSVNYKMETANRRIIIPEEFLKS